MTRFAEQKFTDRDGLPGIQILRGLAALAVLVHHVLEESQPLFDGHIPSAAVVLGASGVDMFFVISGFIMYYTNRDRFGRKGATADFLVRRIFRIVPLYWLCTLAIVALHFTGFYASKKITGASLVHSMLFLPTDDIVLGVGWTLNYEMYFYAVLSVWLLCRVVRIGVLGVVLSIPAIMGLSWALTPGTTRMFLTNPIVLEFCFGFVLAVAYTKKYLPARGLCWIYFLSIAGLLLGAIFGPRDGTTAGLALKIRFLLWGVPATILLIPTLYVERIETRIGKVFLALGNASYSIYLTHAFVMTAYAKILKSNVLLSLPRPLCVFMPIMVSLAVGLITYHLIEYPLNEHLKHWWKRRWRRQITADTTIPE